MKRSIEKAAQKDENAEPVAASKAVSVRKAIIYSDEIATAVCVHIADGMSLRKVCQMPGMPTMTSVMRWLGEEDKTFLREQYIRAREAQADLLAEEILLIADDGRNDSYVDDEGRVIVDHDVIARSRLRVDARKWLASKMAPKKYGDKLTTEHTGAGGGAIEVRSTITLVAPVVRSDEE
jgi:hypothetical protein